MNFKIFICVVTILLVYKSYAYSIPKQLLLTFTDDNDPYQIIVFFNKGWPINKKTFLNDIIRTLSQEIPTILVDLSKEKNTTELLRYSRISTLHVIIDNDSIAGFTNRMQSTMSLIAELTPVLTRPKCLLLLMSKNVLLDYALRIVLLEAWSLKFLNFSIIKFDSQRRTVVSSYNPFAKSFYHKSNLENTTIVFPDKLKNMNKYLYKLAVFNEPQILNIKSQNPNALTVDGLYYPYFEIFAEKLNFELDYTIYDSSNYSEMLEILFKDLENGNINAVPIMMVSALVHGNKHAFGRTLSDSKLVMIVPVVSTVKLDADLEIFCQLFIFPAIVLLLFATRLCLKLTKQHWNAMNVVAILLGITLKNQPRRFAEQIIFVSVVVASMSCSSELLAKLTNVKLVTEEKLFNSVQSIVDSGLPIYGLKRLIRSNESSLDYEIKSRARSIGSAKDCVEILVANRSAICITMYTSSQLLINQHISKGRVMKLADPMFQYDFGAFPFERNSPFVERFDQITQRILEAGLHQAWKYAKYTYARHSRSKQQMDEDTEVHMFELGVFLASAYFLAVIAFTGELLQYNYLSRKTVKR